MIRFSKKIFPIQPPKFSTDDYLNRPVGNIPAGIILQYSNLFYETPGFGRFIEQLYKKNRIII